ncbi:MAG: YeeE/YedE family protein [Bacteriovoracaceae bacterium]
MQTRRHKEFITAIIASILFGAGLEMSFMTNPKKVIGFLNITNLWDPSLMFVMIGAILVNAILFQFIKRRQSPLFAAKFQLPTLTKTDKKLIIGSALFGIGWGIGGFCPGPAVASMMRLQPEIFLVVGSMLTGMWVYKIIEPKI